MYSENDIENDVRQLFSKALSPFTIEIIEGDQTGFKRGPQKYDNIRRTLHSPDQAQKKKKEALY